jgi:hypothetical protein
VCTCLLTLLIAAFPASNPTTPPQLALVVAPESGLEYDHIVKKIEKACERHRNPPRSFSYPAKLFAVRKVPGKIIVESPNRVATYVMARGLKHLDEGDLLVMEFASRPRYKKSPIRGTDSKVPPFRLDIGIRYKLWYRPTRKAGAESMPLLLHEGEMFNVASNLSTLDHGERLSPDSILIQLGNRMRPRGLAVYKKRDIKAQELATQSLEELLFETFFDTPR